jgi:hypothetical protein
VIVSRQRGLGLPRDLSNSSLVFGAGPIEALQAKVQLQLAKTSSEFLGEFVLRFDWQL